jgi:glycosyltransferase involved in cell wall biosynthesis
MTKIRLSVYSDWIFAPTGFGSVAYNLFSRLKEKYDIAQLAINYSGDYHKGQNEYRFYHVGDHPLGFNKIKPFVKTTKPDIFVAICDPWIGNSVITKVREVDPTVPALLYCPVDSPNLDRRYTNTLNQYQHIVTYTEFAKQELEWGGLHVPCTVIPHGVDTDTFYPGDKREARVTLGIPELPDGAFMVTYVASNQPRKKVDVFIYTINEWLRKYPHNNVYFYYHGALAAPGGLDVVQFIDYLDNENKRLGYTFSLSDRFRTTGERGIIQKQHMRYIYQAADLYFHACAVEGWGMPLHEAMATGIPSVAPEYSALAEWPKGGVEYVPVTITPDAVASQVNTLHKTLDIPAAVEILERLYQDEVARKTLAVKGYQIATQDKYQWPVITNQFYRLFESLRTGKETGKE